MRLPTRHAFGLGLYLITVLPVCTAGDVILLRGMRIDSFAEGQIHRIADFYGLDVTTIDARSPRARAEAASRFRSPDTLAILSPPDALAGLDPVVVKSSLKRQGGGSIPLMVFSLDSESFTPSLRKLIGNSVDGCEAVDPRVRPETIRVGALPIRAKALLGRDLTAVTSPGCRARIVSDSPARPLLTARGVGMADAPLFIAASSANDVFLAPRFEQFDDSWPGQPSSAQKAFSSMAPFLVFLAYAAGDFGWHLDRQYANLTIDDPWLTQPYGHLDYPGLLSEMHAHDFHTTLAFIPWNFDRSDPAVADLFRNNPDRFTIAPHGNDHTHKEFGDYQKNPLAEQIADIHQAIARMDKFSALTGIPWDPVMVFPHGVAPERTFVALRDSGFFGTSNSSNVPNGASFPAEPLFLFRPFTVKYANLPSLLRYSLEGSSPEVDVAIQSFLGNPILLYCHEAFFSEGISQFNQYADLVNGIQPQTRWTGLGEIARHLYLVRRRTGQDFDIRLLSADVAIGNTGSSEATFHLERQDETKPQSLFVDGTPADFSWTDGRMRASIRIPGHQVRRVQVNSISRELRSQVSINKGGVYEHSLRWISDVRDLYLSKSSVGRSLTQIYYRRGWNQTTSQLEQHWLAALCALMLVTGAGYFMYKRRRLSLYRPSVPTEFATAGPLPSDKTDTATADGAGLHRRRN
ncbi:MAG: hypothetical protein ABI693_03515 [Bryobacteraceae bacterium]